MKDLQLEYLKKELSKHDLKQPNPALDDAILKGGFRIVRTIKERDTIPCCNRKLGMQVMVIGQAYSYKEYTLKGDNPCSNSSWELNTGGGGAPIDTVDESQVTLIADYTDLSVSTSIETQQDLNRVLVDIVKILVTNSAIGDKNFNYEQVIPSTQWSIVHNLYKKPSVTIVDTAGTTIEGEVSYGGSLTTIIVRFAYPVSGTAFLN